LLIRKKNNIKKENNNVSKRKVVRTLKWVEKKNPMQKSVKRFEPKSMKTENHPWVSFITVSGS
jgi:hypothetical protein